MAISPSSGSGEVGAEERGAEERGDEKEEYVERGKIRIWEN